MNLPNGRMSILTEKKKLGDELRAHKAEREAQFRAERAIVEAAKREKDQALGKELAKEIIKNLPKQLRKENERGFSSIEVDIPDPNRQARHEEFTAAQHHAAYLISEWARGQGIRADVRHYDYWPEGPTGDSLYLIWGE